MLEKVNIYSGDLILFVDYCEPLVYDFIWEVEVYFTMFTQFTQFTQFTYFTMC